MPQRLFRAPAVPQRRTAERIDFKKTLRNRLSWLAARATVGRELGLFDYVRNYVLRRYDYDLILGDKEFVCPNLRYLLGHERWKGPQFDLGRYFLANPDLGAFRPIPLGFSKPNVDSAYGSCPLWVKSGHFAVQLSALPPKVDIAFVAVIQVSAKGNS
jgi:hypothetical protein